MKNKNIIRSVNDLGRGALPLEFRKIFNIKPREQIKLILQSSFKKTK